MIYYIDGARSLSAGLLDHHGLGSLIDSPRCREVVRGGPGGKGGLLVADVSTDCELRFHAEGQTWVDRFGFPGTHVGFWTDSPPTPKSLARNEQIEGESLTLQDGNKWIVPRIRQWQESDEIVTFVTMLRTVLARHPVSGHLVKGPVIRPLRDIWERSCEIADGIIEQMQGGRVEIEPEESDGLISDVLGLNYRIGLDEIGILGLLDDSLYPKILYAALDLYRMMELAGNVQRRLNAAGTADPSTSTHSEFGETQPTADGMTATVQP